MTSVTATPEVSRQEGDRAPTSFRMSDPLPIAFAIFGFALAMYGLRWSTVTSATLQAGPLTEGLNYAVLIGGFAEVLASVFALVRGMVYGAYVTGMFGIWLLGFFLLITQGASHKDFAPDAVAWFCLTLVIPVLIMAVPAFHQRNIPFIIIFVMILLMLILLGIGFHEVDSAVSSATATKPPNLSAATGLIKISGYPAFIAALAVWYLLAKDVFEYTGVTKKTQPLPD